MDTAWSAQQESVKSEPVAMTMRKVRLDANFLGYDCVLVEDFAATTSPGFCVEAALYNIRHASASFAGWRRSSVQRAESGGMDQG